VRSEVTVRAVLFARWRALMNLPQSSADGGWLRMGAFVLMGVSVWVGIYAATHWFVGKTMLLEPFGDILVRKLLSLTFLVLLGVLLFSHVISAFSTFLLSEELRFVLVRPIAATRLYTARFIETCLDSSWMVLVFAAPVFIATGVNYGAPLTYYLWLLLLLVPMVVLVGAVGVMVVLLLAVLLPAQRSREIMVVLAVVAFVGLFAALRSLEPERLLNPRGFATTMEFFSTLQAPGRYWMPSSWVVEVLYPQLVGGRFAQGLHLGCLYFSAAGAFFTGGWLFRWLHPLAYSRAQLGRHDGGGPAVQQAQVRRRRRASAWVARWQRRGGVLGPIGAIAWKDIRVFVRDTVQWSQLMLLGGLVFIYLINFQYIGVIGKQGGILGPMGLYVLNLALCGFMVAAMGVRLVFPAVSLEGRAFWLIHRAPLTLGRYLLAKWLGHTLQVLVLAQVVVVLSSWMIGLPSWLVWKSAVLMALLAFSIAGLGVGMGAMFPRFHVDSAARIATGLGGVLYMFSAIALTVGVIVLDAYPTYHLLRADIFGSALPPRFVLEAGPLWLGAAVLSLGSALTVLWVGARRLGSR